jgi:hypothetical protein
MFVQIRSDIDSIALGPYFDGFDASVTNVPEMLGRYRQALRESMQLVDEHAAMARRANMSLVAYEAGPGAPVGTFNDVGIGTYTCSCSHVHDQTRASMLPDTATRWRLLFRVG